LQNRVFSPVLLLGAGTGEATCGILYLAGYLRRGGIEAFVRLHDADETDEALTRSLEALVARVRPRLVGISLKWFHHVHRALVMARALRKIDPTIRIVLGGNTASHWWKELLAFDCIDDIIMGDGERPLLALCRGDSAPPNCRNRAQAVPLGRPKHGYVQSADNSDDAFYSHFDEIFLSQQDRSAFSGWVAPGRGCSENCLYCGGSSGNQRAEFGRGTTFVRPVPSVQRDHAAIAPHTWQMRYDFPGSTAEYLRSTWEGVDLSRHACTYFMWGVPNPAIVDALAGAFERVFVVNDIGCFSESQRTELRRRGMLKPCATNAQLDELIERSRRHSNVELEVSGIAGLPFASPATLAEELRLVEKVIGLNCVAGFQRLEAQPGALATEHPARFDMETPARTFSEFVTWFEKREPGDNSVPMLRFRDDALEDAVQRTYERAAELAEEHRATRKAIRLTDRTRLKNTAPSLRRYPLGDWLGSHRVPAKLAGEEVTVVRAVDGATIVCAPTLTPRRFREPRMNLGRGAQTLLSGLASFDQPTTVGQALTRLISETKLVPSEAREAIELLVERVDSCSPRQGVDPASRGHSRRTSPGTKPRCIPATDERHTDAREG
jgi:hypothetical protein